MQNHRPEHLAALASHEPTKRSDVDGRSDASNRWGQFGTTHIALAAILVLGVALRLPLLMKYEFSPDELHQLVIANGRGLSDVFAGLVWEPHPPLTIILSHYLLMLGRGVIFQRMLSFACGVLLVGLNFRVGCRVDGKRLGLTAAALTAIGPGQILQSQVVRPYALVQLCIAAAVYAALARQSARHSLRAALPLAAASVAALCSEYTAAVAIAAIDAGLLFGAIKTRNRFSAWRVLAMAWAAQALALLWCYAVHVRYVAAGGAFDWWRDYAGEWSGGGLGPAVTRISQMFEYQFGAGTEWVWTVMLVLGALRLGRINADLALMVVAALCIGVAASAANALPLGPVRQTLACEPLFVLAVGSGLLDAARLAGKLVRESRAASIVRVGVALSAFPVIAPMFTDLSRFPYVDGEFCVSHRDFQVLFSALSGVDARDLIVTDEQSLTYLRFYGAHPTEKHSGALARIDVDDRRFYFRPGDGGGDPRVPCEVALAVSPFLPSGGRVWFLHVGWYEQRLRELARNDALRGYVRSLTKSGSSVLMGISASAFVRSDVCAPPSSNRGARR